MRVLATGDWHGKIIEVKEKPDIIIYIGDFCDFTKIRQIIFEFRKRGLSSEEAEKKVPKELYEESVETGRKVLEYLNSFGVPVVVIPGNVDSKPQVIVELWKELGFLYNFPIFWEDFIKDFENVVDCFLKVVEISGIIFFGTSCESYKEKGKVYQLYKKYEPEENFDILLSHLPPYNTELDLVRIKESPRYGQHIGSIIVRELIEKFQPKYCFCGHLHENAGLETRIGRTKVVNVAGKLYYFEL